MNNLLEFKVKVSSQIQRPTLKTQIGSDANRIHDNLGADHLAISRIVVTELS